MEKSPISAGALFRKAALEGVNEAPFLDLHRDDSGRRKQTTLAFGIIGVATFLAICISVLLLPFPVVKRYPARLSWDPPPISVATDSEAVVQETMVGLNQTVHAGEVLALLSSDETVHPNSWEQLETATIETKLQTLQQTGRVLTELNKKVEDISHLVANSSWKLASSEANLQEALNSAIELQKEIVEISERANGKRLISDREMMEARLAAAQERSNAAEIMRNADEGRDVSRSRLLNISNMASEVQRRIADNNNEILSLTLRKAQLDPRGRRQVRAPVDGTISSLPLGVGAKIRPADNLFIIRPRNAVPVVTFEVPVSEKAEIEGSLRASLRFPISSGLSIQTARIRTTALDRADQRLLSVILDVGEEGDSESSLERYVGLNVNTYLVVREQSMLGLMFGRDN